MSKRISAFLLSSMLAICSVAPVYAIESDAICTGEKEETVIEECEEDIVADEADSISDECITEDNMECPIEDITSEVDDCDVVSDDMVEDYIIDEPVTDEGGVSAKYGKYINNFNEGHWVNSWSEAKTYATQCIAKGQEFICIWIYDDDFNKASNLYMDIIYDYMGKFGDMPIYKSAYGGCSFTSPYPNGMCIQFYSDSWLDSHLPGIAANFMAEEVSTGVQLSWSKPAGVTEQQIYVSADKGAYYESKYYNVPTTQSSYIDTKTCEGTKYLYSIMTCNEYGYSSTNNITITCTHNGKDYSCKHTFAKEPTFKWASDGRSCTASAVCKSCNKTISKSCNVSVRSYSKADFSRDGKIVYSATTSEFGGYKSSKKTINYYQLSTVKLEYSSKTYKGSKLKPSVKVYDRKGNVVPSKFYSVSYSGNNRPGKATATVTFGSTDGKIAPYCGSVSKTFTIKLSKPKILKVTSKSKGFKIDYSKVPGAKTYVVEYSLNKDFKNSVTKKTSNTSLTVTKLKPGKKYYVRVRVQNSSSCKSGNSDYKTVKTKK